MTYMISSGYIANLVTAESVLGKVPKSIPVPGGIQEETLAGTQVWHGYPRSQWKFNGAITIAQYQMALAILTSSLGTGTLTGSVADLTVTGSGTAFDTELAVGDVIAAHLGSGVYEVMTIATVTDATNLEVVALPGNDFTTRPFLYRKPYDYSRACYVQTRDDLDNFLVYSAICRFAPTGSMERWGGKYQNLSIEFLLTGIVEL